MSSIEEFRSYSNAWDHVLTGIRRGTITPIHVDSKSSCRVEVVIDSTVPAEVRGALIAALDGELARLMLEHAARIGEEKRNAARREAQAFIDQYPDPVAAPSIADEDAAEQLGEEIRRLKDKGGA